MVEAGGLSHKIIPGSVILLSMVPKVKKLLKQYNTTSLRELAKELKISLDKIKNISCGRTSFVSLFRKKSQYRIFPRRSEKLAELIGVTLGDGNIFQFDRCQRLMISCNSAYRKYIEHIYHLVKSVFKKEPCIAKRTGANCYDVRLYMQDIDKTLELPVGNKIKNKVAIPAWIFKKKEYLIRCLKGLFETDGHYGLNKKFHVEYMQFCNKSNSLRESVFRALLSLGYSPQLGNSYVRLAKKAQVHKFFNEVGFVRPFPSLMKG